MPTLIGPAVDNTLTGPARAWGLAGELLEPAPPRVPDGPGDPDVEWTLPPTSRAAPLVQVMLGEATAGHWFGELTTADVEDWVTDVELLAGAPATITASSSDPLWAAIDGAATVHLGADGLLKYEWNPKQYRIAVYLDGVREWVGMFRQPINIGDGKVVLAAQGPQEVFAERILGRPEQVDLLGGRGSFEPPYLLHDRSIGGGPNPLAGWQIPDGVEAEVISSDGVRGNACLRVRGNGWVGTPKVIAKGANGYGRAIVGSVFGKWDDTVKAGEPVVLTYTQRTDSLAPSNQDITLESAGRRPDDSSGWTDDPVSSGTRMSKNVITHRCWVALRSFADVWSYYDLVTLRESTQTGFPPGSERDLSLYIPRVHRDLESRALGGSATGLVVRVRALTGRLVSKRWSHARRTQVHDVLSAILDEDGGPECRITRNWVLEVWDRLGADRDDIVLSVHQVAAPGWSTDPGAQVDDFIVETGRGNGVTSLPAVYSTPYVPGAFRIVAQVTGPNDRTLNELDSWTRAHGRTAARIQSTGDADVSWEVARQIADGDTFVVALHDGAQGIHRRIRCLRHRWQPKRGRCILTWGSAD